LYAPPSLCLPFPSNRTTYAWFPPRVCCNCYFHKYVIVGVTSRRLVALHEHVESSCIFYCIAIRHHRLAQMHKHNNSAEKCVVLATYYTKLLKFCFVICVGTSLWAIVNSTDLQVVDFRVGFITCKFHRYVFLTWKPVNSTNGKIHRLKLFLFFSIGTRQYSYSYM